MTEPNIIFIVIDTLRKDYAKILEDTLKPLGFISYENTIAPAPWTLPTHASIFTGTYPAFHGVHETHKLKNPAIKFKNTINTLHDQLRDIGYTTYLLSANPYISPLFGFRGFDYFYDIYVSKYSLVLSEKEQEEIDILKSQYDTLLGITKALIGNQKYKLLVKATLSFILWKSRIIKTTWPFDMGMKRAIKLLKNLPLDKHRPIFLFMNLMEVHEPYDPSENPKKILEAFMENLKTGNLNWKQVELWRDRYPKEVKYVTEKILEIFQVLMNKQIFDNSLIIITSDHGQLLGEHGRIGHGVFLYDELLKIPLLIKYPKNLDIELTSGNSQYISLTKLKNFIMRLIKGDSEDDKNLFSETVFSETYGIQDKIRELKSKDERKNIEQLEKYRIAIYYKNFKGIFNVTDWKFERVISYDPDVEITDDILVHMKKEIVKFLKTITVAKVPKIKL